VLRRAYPAKEAPMRIPALAILTTVTILTAAPTLAQTYSPDYPVCLHVYSENGGIDCAYTSLAQCNASASGRGAECITNPYFASAQVPPGPRDRRHRRVY
jgi:Protein of unknown function (DUF3551)